jgi:S1-C subfamily serine protease
MSCRSCLAGIVLLLAAVGAHGDERPGLAQVLALEQTLQQVIQQAEPAIACILVSRSDQYRIRFHDAPPPDNPGQLGGFDLPGPRGRSDDPELRKLDLADPNNVPESYGSGVVVDRSGLILTNYHVVRDATKVYVRLPGDRACYANIHAADPRSDLAVLRLIDPRLQVEPLRLGDGGAVRKGQLVVSLANPFAAGFRDGSPSASWGIISNIRRRMPPPVREEDRRLATLHQHGTLLQTDARLNLGCSGGALLNLKGELIGLTTAVAALSGSETAGGYAVPIDSGMRRIIEDRLLRGEEVEYGFLGVSPRANLARGQGAQIDQADEGTPAYRAGLRPGDVIVAVDNLPVREWDDLFLHVGMRLAGSKVRITVRRGDHVLAPLEVTLAKYYVPGRIIASHKVPAVRGLRVDYVSVLQQKHPFPRSPRFASVVNQGGVFVTEVLPESPAARARLQPNEVITHVNDRPVNTPAEFYQAILEVNKKQGPAAPIELTLASSDWHRGFSKVTLN